MSDQTYPWMQYFSNECCDPFHGWVYDIDDAVDVIREFSYATCTSYTVTRSSKRFGEFELGLSKEEHVVRFKDDSKVQHSCRIPSDGTPFMIVGLRRMECHQGPSHNTKSLPEDEIPEHGYSLAPNKKKITGSKKRGCPAHIVMREVIHFPQYQISKDSQHWREKISAELRNDLLSPVYEEVVYKKVIYIDLPMTDVHQYHILGKAADLKAPIDERVCKKIRALVDEGIFNAREMQRHIKLFVRTELFPGRELPQIINRRFFPSKEDIRKLIYHQRRKTIHSFIDQENLVEKMNHWKDDHPDDSWTLRLSSFVKRPLNEDEEDDEADAVIKLQDDSFLVVFQTAWQRRLLDRYGKEVVFLDATYRTTKYALPLFFLCVQTNSGYCVVGSFITEREDTASVAEALQVIRDNNPTWHPGSFMVDASEVEANAINISFPDSKLFICDFHRKQAWLRWVNTLKNDVNKQDETLKLMNAVAESCTPDEYKQNLNRLKESEIWKTQPKLRQYMQTQWLIKHETWVWAFRNCAMTLVVNTNNGVESQNKVFKHAYLSSLPVKTVTSLMTVLVEDFFVDAERSSV